MKKNDVPKNWVLFTNYAFVNPDKLPSEISLKDHLIPFDAAASQGNPRGVYGAPAREAALFTADTAAHRRGMGTLVVKSWFELDSPASDGGMIERIDIEEMQTARILDMRRLKARLRDHIANQIFKMLSPAARSQFENESPNLLYDVAVEHPHLALVLFDQYPSLQGVIHPLRLDYGLPEFATQTPVPVLTMRDMASHRHSEVLHHEESIKVNV